MPLKFDFNKIKFATDEATFKKAVDLYEKGKVKDFEEGIGSYSAKVQGGKDYQVSIEARCFRLGFCNCYLGQHDYLCKHIVALSIYAVQGGKPISESEKEIITDPKCSGRQGELSKTEFAAVKKSISTAIAYIKAYTGPSRTWFAYQNSLSEGCNRLSAIISDLPVSEQTADLLVNLLLRLDKKLMTGGVDDSDGTVGGFIEEVVKVLEDYAALDKRCKDVFKKLIGVETCFGWEEPLLKYHL